MVFGGALHAVDQLRRAGNPLFTSPPGCYLHHQGSFITDFFVKANPNLKPVEDFNFFPFPDINAQYAGGTPVAGDLFGMFRDTPQSRALMNYLTTPGGPSHLGAAGRGALPEQAGAAGDVSGPAGAPSRPRH